MSVSLHDVGALLLKWQEQGKEVSVDFSRGFGNVFSLSCTGKVTHVFLTRFAVSWGVGASVELLYDKAKPKISEDGRTLHFVYSSSESLVVSEVGS